jgi:hypothetical protein
MKNLFLLAAVSCALAAAAWSADTAQGTESIAIWQALADNGYTADVQIADGCVYAFFDSAQDLSAVAFTVGITCSVIGRAAWWDDKLVCGFEVDSAVVWLTAADCRSLCELSEAGYDLGKAFLDCLHYDNANNW